MSTDYILESLEGSSAPRLKRFVPVLHGVQQARRMMSLDPAIYDWLMRPVAGDALTQLKAQTRNHFAQFVLGEQVDDCDFMKRVFDYRMPEGARISAEVWSIRPDFRPKHRFFGAFFRENWFVVLTKRPRDQFVGNDPWHAQIDTVIEKWDALFQHTPRFAGATFQEYITFNAEHCDERW